MPGAIGLGIILLGMAVLILTHGREDIAGLRPDELAAVVALGALALVVAASVVREFHGRWMAGVQAMLFWAVLTVALIGAYSYRGELQVSVSRLLSEISPGEPVVGPGGEVSVARRLDGTFVVAVRAGGRDLRFIFDTGASTVVLTAESAQALGYSPANLSYIVPVMTANGRTMAAPVTLDSLTIGSITERRVRALVARPGVLRENLLGMTFLERLASYEVRGNRLILRGRGA
jgi:aspartyl protease family protein